MIIVQDIEICESFSGNLKEIAPVPRIVGVVVQHICVAGQGIEPCLRDYEPHVQPYTTPRERASIPGKTSGGKRA